jgi:hypothetical protein
MSTGPFPSIDPPAWFPLDLYEWAGREARIHLPNPNPEGENTVVYRRWGTAWVGLGYRARAADDYAADLIRLSEIESLSFEDKYEVQRALLGFFVSAVSALECFVFAAYVIAASHDSRLDPAQERNVTIGALRAGLTGGSSPGAEEFEQELRADSASVAGRRALARLTSCPRTRRVLRL